MPPVEAGHVAHKAFAPASVYARGRAAFPSSLVSPYPTLLLGSSPETSCSGVGGGEVSSFHLVSFSLALTLPANLEPRGLFSSTEIRKE